ncbi:MAG: CAP domain-containing protein [Bacteroidales bacterium]|nr:CAP domain-containing protein [Bacteroidales bacterium]
MKKKLLFAVILIVVSAVIYTSCDKDDDGTGVTSIIVSPADTTVSHSKGTIQYSCVVNYTNGQSIDGTTHVSWGSSDVNTAIISNAGATKGLASTVGSGVTMITASLEGVQGAATLEVSGLRGTAINEYINNYLGSELSSLGWTGAVAGCIAGDISMEAHNKVIQRMNYFRKIVGLPGTITFNAGQTDMCQECALMMKANNSLSHNPPPSWLCYTADGAYAAGGSNIAWGIHSVNAITGYIEDPGANNTGVGHRTWILLPELIAMGDGSTDNTNSIMWKENLGSVPSSAPDYIAYPPNGYIPSSLVFPRWSFSIFEAGFSSATVTMTDDSGNNVSLNIIDRISGYKPDNRIVWEPSGINTSSVTDVTYTVTVANVTNTSQASYTYDVILFKPPTVKTGYQKIKEEKVEFEIR